VAKVKIPGGITAEDFLTISKHLRGVLKETNAKQVVLRLNETGKDEPAPVFVGWVEDPELTEERLEKNEPDPGLFRFADTTPSTTYDKCFRNGGDPNERNWKLPSHLKERKPKELGQASKAGVNYLRFIGIIGGDGNARRCVGILSAGFSEKPDDFTIEKVDKILKRWAQSSSSELVAFFKGTFELGGPALKN